MRAWGWGGLVPLKGRPEHLRFVRRAATFTVVYNAQRMLERGKAPAEADATMMAEYLSLPIQVEDCIPSVVKAHYDKLMEAAREQHGSHAIRAQKEELHSREAIPLLLVSYDVRSKVFSFFSVESDAMATVWTAGDDPWKLADDIIKFTRSLPQVALLPVFDDAREEQVVTPYLQTAAAAFREAGFLVLPTVSNVELLATFTGQPTTPKTLLLEQRDRVVFNEGGERSEVLLPYSTEWFQGHWAAMRSLACEASPKEDAVSALMRYLAPKDDVFVVHLVRAGSKSVNIVLWDPVHSRRYAAKGMLSDVLACLLERQTKHFILLPTNRTDRPVLFSCRSALKKAGRSCTLVFASEIDDGLRGVYNSDPQQYWKALRDVSKCLDADFLFRVYQRAGTANRATLKAMRSRVWLHATLTAGDEAPDESLVAEVDGSGGELDDEATSANAEEPEVVACGKSVEKWLQPLSSPKRRRREELEQRKYDRYLAVAFVATEHAALTRPANATVAANYVIAACLVNHRRELLEPLTTYSQRGSFSLPCLDEVDVLVVHDAKHFLLLIWDDVELRKFLKRGGRIWCTRLAQYLLDGQRTCSGHNSLGEVVFKLGVSLPPSKVLGADTVSLPLEFHRRYAIPAAKATVLVFRNQLKRAVAQSQMVCLSHRMDSLLCMTGMEHAGIHVDVEEARIQSEAVQNRSHAILNALEMHVPPEVPLDMRGHFDWSSQQHVSALLFGGTIQLGGLDAVNDSPAWTSNFVTFCDRYGDLGQLSGSAHLQRYAASHGVSASSSRLPSRIADHLRTVAGGRKATSSIATKTVTQPKSKSRARAPSPEVANESAITRGGSALKVRAVVFDIESTGLNVPTDEIIEIAMWDPVEDTAFSSLVNPGRPIQPRSIKVHHITDAMVKSSPTIDKVGTALAQFLRLDKSSRDPNEIVVLIAHNVFGLDEPLLRRALNGVQPPVDTDGLLFCDSLALLKHLKTELLGTKKRTKHQSKVLAAISPSMRLPALTEAFKVNSEDGELHRASTDARMLWAVLCHCLGVASHPPQAQRDAIFAWAARSVHGSAEGSCFVQMGERRKLLCQVNLRGAALGFVAPRTLNVLKRKGCTDATLEALHGFGVTVAGLLLEKQKLDRHTARFLNPTNDSRLTVLHADHRVRQFIDMTATTTSRTTSAYPSCQNIAKDDKSSVRRLFVSRFGENGRCVEIDYSQLEIVVLAILCGDKNLTGDLNRGVDFHIRRAEFFSGIPYDEIYAGCKRGDQKYVSLRRTAKNFSFQRLYGAGVPLLHKTTGIPVKDLEASIAAENREYPGIAAFHHLVRATALRAQNPGLPTHFVFELPTGLRMSFKMRDIMLNLPPVKNYPIQGYGAELAQMMVGRVMRHFLQRDFYNNKAFLINFVHDSLWLDCHVDVVEECTRDTATILSDVHRYVPAQFPGVKIDVPLKVSIQCGLDMFSLTAVDDDFKAVRAQSRVPPPKKRGSLAGQMAARKVPGVSQDHRSTSRPTKRGRERSSARKSSQSTGASTIRSDDYEDASDSDEMGTTVFI